MDFKRFSQEAVEHIDKELKRLLKEWRSEVGKTSASLLPLVDKFIKACEGGKRLRGTLVKLGYEIGKQSSAISYQLSDKVKDSLMADSEVTPKADEAILKAESPIIKIAAAYEIFHAAILVHDDIIDKSKIRRGKPSLYQALGGGHYGISQAICLGDIGFFLATKIIAESDFADREKNQALRWFSQTMLDTAVGEMLDIEHGDVETIMKLKTAKYTVSGPLILGAILAGAESDSAGAEKRLVGVLGEFGENLGIAFQIQDDILGVFGSEEELGKSTTSDVEEGKATLLSIHARKQVDQEQKNIFKRVYGQGKISLKELEEVRRVFRDSGALDYAQAERARYTKQAEALISQLTDSSKQQALLVDMAKFLLNRTK